MNMAHFATCMKAQQGQGNQVCGGGFQESSSESIEQVLEGDSLHAHASATAECGGMDSRISLARRTLVALVGSKTELIFPNPKLLSPTCREVHFIQN